DLPSGASIVITLFIAGMLFNLLLQPFLVKITKPAFVRD
ncbi:metal ABC transporter permease, partial [Vibrio parahaemolyticus]|nr:metal ABC transporter permease [Vibrio parahaemolyticus]